MSDALVICRLLHWTTAIAVFGVSLFQWRLAPAPLRDRLAPLLGGFAGASAVLAAATTVAWLFLVSAEIGEGPATVRVVLLETQFGNVWQWRLALAAALIGAFAIAGQSRWLVIVILSALLLGSSGLVGHSTMLEGRLGWLNRSSHVVHLLAAGFWLGSLIPVLLTVRSLGDPKWFGEASLALRRFSLAGHFAVLATVLSGGINTWLILGSWPMNPASPYQALLLAKIILVAVMIGLALVNRYALVPRLRARPRAAILLGSITGAEIGLGLVVLGLVSLFGTMAPE
ncbi:MAG: copper homeostasis membrane protein CopD [Hyphomicrobiales bacterium]